MDIRFTDTAGPLFITVEGDNSNSFFVISTSQVHGSNQKSQTLPGSRKKREREETTPADTPRFKKPMKVVRETDNEDLSRSSRSRSGSMLPPRSSALRSQPHDSQTMPAPTPAMSTPQGNQEPLFLPVSSQPTHVDDHEITEDPAMPSHSVPLHDDGDPQKNDHGPGMDIDEPSEIAPTQSNDFHDRSKVKETVFYGQISS